MITICRRQCLSGLVSSGVLALGWPSSASAQSPSARRRIRVGVLEESDRRQGFQFLPPLLEALAELGYAEPQTLEVVVVSAEGAPERLPALAQQLVERKVEVIVSSGTFAMRAAAQASKDVPVVSAGTNDLVGSGLAASLARPGGNVTGLSILITETSLKAVRFAAEIIPMFRRFAVLSGPAGGTARGVSDYVRSSLAAEGIEVTHYHAGSAAELNTTFEAMTARGIQAVLVVPGGVLRTQIARLSHLVAQHRLPLLTTSRDYEGFLLSYGADRFALQRRTASYIDQIVRGARAAELPIEQPTVFELVVNAKVARELGMPIPTSILARADEVIE